MSEFFPDVPKIAYGGPKSRNPLEFKHYNPDEVVGGKTMKEHLRFSVVYWHTFRNPLSDPFGAGTAVRPWDDGTRLGRERPAQGARSPSSSSRSSASRSTPSTTATSPPRARRSRRATPTSTRSSRSSRTSRHRTGVKLLWGTANLFSNPRYMHGAATSPNLDVFAYAAAQVKKALEVTHELGGEGYTFWGGREGYSTLCNTDMKRELDHLAAFLHMAVDYKKQIGFTGPFYIEPKPKEPTKHQYDSDAAACLNFLRTYGLLPHFKLNLETNHATLAGHEMMHELRGRHRRRRARLDRRQHRRPAPRLGHRPVPDRHLPDDPVHALHPGHGRLHHRRRELRRQGPPRELRADRPLPRPHRRHGRLRPRPEDRPRDHRRRPPRGVRQGALPELGQRARPQGRERPSHFADLEAYILPKGDAAPNASGRQEMLENLINEFI